MENQITTTLGQHKGKPRFWVEGVKLKQAGVQPGYRYKSNFDYQSGELVFKLDPKVGDYKVKVREKNGRSLPIVDLRADELLNLFGENETLLVKVANNEIIVTSHNSNDDIIRRETRLNRKIKAGLPLDVVSLCHGTGVLDKALHEGFAKTSIATQISVVCEINGDYLDNSVDKNTELFNRNSLLLNMPIQHVNPYLLKSLGEKDLVVAGLPCTASSNQGRAKKKDKNPLPEADKEAGSLFFYFLEIVRAVNPALILIENVTNYANDASMMVIRSVLDSLGYEISERNFHGNEFGALEARNRFVCFAFSKNLELHGALESVVNDTEKESCVADVLEDIADDSPLWRTFDYLHAKELRDRAKGNCFAQQLLSGHEDKIGVIGRGYQKARSSEARIVHPKKPHLSRLLTLKEHCAIKKIPFELIDGAGLTKGHEMLGQSVIYSVFTAVGKGLGTKLNESCNITALAA